MVYSSMELFEKAKKYNLKAINKFTEVKNLKGISESYNNYAIALANQDSLDLAADFFKKSLQIEIELNDKKGISESLNNIGGIYYYKGELNNALEYFFKVIKIEKEVKNYGGVASTYNNISQVLYDSEKYVDSKKYTDSAYFYSKKYNISNDLLTSLESYIHFYEKSNNFKEANAYYKKYISANDSIAKKNNYDIQANQLIVKNLKGKLLIAHGMLDDNVPPSNTMLVVDELIKANKDFDLILFPNKRHGYGDMSNYMMRRKWDYFVKNLKGLDPPSNFSFD